MPLFSTRFQLVLKLWPVAAAFKSSSSISCCNKLKVHVLQYFEKNDEGQKREVRIKLSVKNMNKNEVNRT
jgi:hypothetical protein